MKAANETRQSQQEEEEALRQRQQIEENSTTITHLQDELRARYGTVGTVLPPDVVYQALVLVYLSCSVGWGASSMQTL